MQRFRSVGLLKVLSASALLASVVGCYENHHHHTDTVVEERTVVREPPPQRVVVEERPVVVSSSTWYDEPRWAGHYEVDKRDRHSRADKNVPKVAVEEAIGRNVIGWTAPRPVYVWVTESQHDTVIWSGKVWPGESVEVVPKHNRVFVGHREVVQRPMKDDIRYRIWSDRGALRL